MNIGTSAGLSAAVTAADSSGGQLQALVLSKVLGLQTANADSLLQSLPQPALATSGSVGTQVNTYA